MQNPLSKDVMLADEAGLSKTIEVTLVLPAESRRQLLYLPGSAA